MAYAALVSLEHTIDQILNHHEHYITPSKKRKKLLVTLCQKRQLISLHKNVILLQTFLNDFPEKATSFEGRIRDGANEAEDIIEYIVLKKIQPRYRSTVSSGIYSMMKSRDKIHSIAREMMVIKNSIGNKEVIAGDYSVASSTKRLAPTKSVMVGFDDDLIAIKERLCGESSKLQVIPIVGMGGIGKTTLARYAYDDPLVLYHFHIRAWITVSQDYNAQGILANLSDSINSERSRKSKESNAENVYKSLKGNRYLIVMDDMWSTRVWDEVKMIFPNDYNGSRIILTTRLLDVALYPDSCSPPHEMHFMDEDQSWNLLRQKALIKHQDCPPELEDIGKKIARSCRGLPLAIVVIAGLLSSVSKSRASREEIAENVNSVVATKDGSLEKILSLSYSHLPHHLRPCFLYMGIFPEDCEIHVSELIKLWIAEGFLKHPNGSKSFEEGAEECLEDLVKRSLVLVTKKKSNGKIKSCSIHDLLRVFCKRKAQEEKFILHAEKVLPERMKDQRRINLTHFNQDCLANIFGSTARTIKFFKCERLEPASLGNFSLLRVFDAVYAKFNLRKPIGREERITLRVQVCELVRLKYIAFMYPIKIPAAISNLQNLQTLLIRSAKTERDYPNSCVSLPVEIWRMPQLRHLISFFFGPLPNPEEPSSFPLENLQTLSLATDFNCNKEFLKMVPNLKNLGLFYQGYGSGEYYRLEDLASLHQLEKLKIKVYYHYYAHFPSRTKLHPTFPRTLKQLTLSGWRLPWERMTSVGLLPNLQVLKLRDFACQGPKWETNEGEFSALRFLLIDKSDLQHWITERSHFPSLQCLVLHRCWCLRDIPDGIVDIPTLELIEVENGSKSLVESAKRIQEEQQDCGNDALQVRCHQVSLGCIQIEELEEGTSDP